MRSRLLAGGSIGLAADGSLPVDRPFRALDVPVSPQRLAELVQSGHLRRVVRGVYVASSVRDTLGLRARALALVVPPGAVVTDRTAAWLHGVDVLLPGEHQVIPPVHVFHRARGNRLRQPGVASGQRMMPDRDVEKVDGVTVTTPLRTACDLGRDRNRDRAFGALEAMVRAGVEKDALLAELPRFAGYRWVRQLRALAPLVDHRAESIAESITRLRWLDTCTPYPEPQRPVSGPAGEPWRLDLGVDELWFAVEYDGADFHAADTATYDAFRRGWIEQNTPWMVRVVTKENVFGKEQDFQRLLRQWIAEARRSLGERLGRPRWYDAIGD